VDLSFSSLSYAIRKAEELRAENIEFMQGDILELQRIGRQFDIVESVGVLHHMDDPLAGWRVLVDVLRPGGLMKIGLYSNIARREIFAARRLIADNGYSATPDGIRRFRRDVVNMIKPTSSISGVTKWSDFNSMSACRDLLFHVQEHCFTLTQIAEAVEKLGLVFLGFEMGNAKVMRRFRKENPAKDSLASLQLWSQFEQQNPDTFKGMYQFWVQHPG
ncbi:MAG: class I SAM-dependent methyltransferase, partial [Magnetococcales bacterium]|nr:class I SAM-dependent methyltransferase [Magnetococcales bacterium]